MLIGLPHLKISVTTKYDLLQTLTGFSWIGQGVHVYDNGEKTTNIQYKFDAQFVYKEWLHICSPVLSLELAHTTNYAIGIDRSGVQHVCDIGENTQNTHYNFDAQFVYKLWFHARSPVLSLWTVDSASWTIPGWSIFSPLRHLKQGITVAPGSLSLRAVSH